MGCGCGASTPIQAPGSYTVYYADGSTRAYRTEVEALAEAARYPGASVLPNG